MANLGRKLIIGLVFGVVVLVVLGLWADGRALASSLVAFSWPTYGLVLGLTLVNYVLRFLKWHYYLSRLGHRVRLRDSVLVFLSGMSMSVTPGKVGELVKAVLLADRTGVPAAATAAVVVGERMTDLVALVLLSAWGVVASGHGTWVLIAAAAGTAGFIAVAGSDSLSRGVIRIVGRLPLGARIAPKLEAMRASMKALVAPVPLLIATVLSICSWGCECVGYDVVLDGLPGTSSSLGTATFIYAFATVFGAVTFLPGGLGATEGSLVGLTYTVFALAPSMEVAIAGALLIRFATLWFGVLIGFIAWGILRSIPRDAPLVNE